MDLPGVYGMDLDVPESQMCRDCLDGRFDETPDTAVVVVDATGLSLAIAATDVVCRRSSPSTWPTSPLVAASPSTRRPSADDWASRWSR